MMRSLAAAVKAWLGGSLAVILTLAMLAGCQPTFLTKEVWDQAHSNLLPPGLEQSRVPPTAPIIPETKAPPNVNFPDREQWEMTLQEAVAIALETGLVSANVPEGTAATNLAQGTVVGSYNNQTDYIRVLALNPALYQASIEASLARFDAIWVNSFNANSVDAIPSVPNLPGGSGTLQSQNANFGSSIVKAFADGSVGNVSFLVNYRNITNFGGEPSAFFGPFDPQYSARLSFGYEIPLWRDSGVEINSLLPRLSSITGASVTDTFAATGYNAQQNRLSSFVNQPVEGTLISRLRFDQSRAEFERNVQTLLKNVEIAYWNLYNSYGQLYSFEENLRILQRAYQENDIKLRAGNLDPYKYWQTKGQYEDFRFSRVQALQAVLNAELQLRGILGLPVEDGKRIVPITPPSLAEIKPDWQSCLQDALSLRPELVLARENVRYHQYQLTIQKNNLRPDLRAFMKYEPFGDGPSLAGASPAMQATDPFNGVPIPTDPALRSLAGGHLIDWTAGVYMNIPLGFRFELASLRAAKLQLTQSYYFLKDQEQKAVLYLAEQYQDAQAKYKQIEAARSSRIAYVESLKTLEAKIKVGTTRATYGDLEFLTVQQAYAAALVKEYQAISDYNNSLARLEWAKGTTLQYNNVHISEGPLPQCAQERAVDYQRRETQKALKLWERPDSLAQPARLCAKKEAEVLAPDQLPPVTVTESEPPAWQGPTPAPAPAPPAVKSKVETGPIAPASVAPPVAPPPEKIEFKSSSAAPAPLPIMPNQIRPVETPNTPLFVQPSAELRNGGPSFGEPSTPR